METIRILYILYRIEILYHILLVGLKMNMDCYGQNINYRLSNTLIM